MNKEPQNIFFSKKKPPKITRIRPCSKRALNWVEVQGALSELRELTNVIDFGLFSTEWQKSGSWAIKRSGFFPAFFNKSFDFIKIEWVIDIWGL